MASLDHYDFSNMIEYSLVTASARSFRTLGCVSSGPINLCLFCLISLSQICSLLTVGGNFLSQCPPGVWGNWEMWEAWLPVQTEAKNLMSTSAFSIYITISSFLFVRGLHYSWHLFLDLCIYRINSCFCFVHSSIRCLICLLNFIRGQHVAMLIIMLLATCFVSLWMLFL